MVKPVNMVGWGPTYVENLLEDGTWEVIVTPAAFMAGKPIKVFLTNDQYTRYLQWRRGGLIQDALPELSRQEREKLISGVIL